MINSMLGLADIESGRLKLEIETYDLRETLRRVCRTISPMAQEKSLDLNVDVPEGLPMIEGDERKIQQAVLNLMSNAAKFTPEKGRIQLRANHFRSWDELEEATTARHRFDHPERIFSNGGFKVVVEDSGTGIPKEHCDRIFDMFYQVDGTSTRSFGGIGLGLAIARQFVEMHGGRIWVESKLGRGARFTILIPCTLV
jgi:two-component system sensor histidine kinase BarA